MSPGLRDDDPRLQAARVATLFGAAKTAYLTTFAGGGLLAVIVWGPTTSDVLLGWLAALLALTLVRVGIHAVYLRRPAARAPAQWEASFALGAFAAGALWVVPPALFFPTGDSVLQMALLVVVGGSVIGATGVYAASSAAFFGFCLLPIGGMVVQLAQQPGRVYQLLALMGLVFGAAMIRLYRDLQGRVVGALSARIENDDLIERLALREAQLRDAIESFPEGIAVYDLEDRLLVCNDAYAGIYGAGRSAAQLAGTSYREIARNAYAAEIVPAEYAGRPEDWLADRLARRHSGAGAVRQYRTRDGRSLQGRFVRSRGGGIVSVFTDVTELDRAQEAYRRILAEENLILDTLPVGVAFVADRAILRCNSQLERMLGYEAGELHGASTRKLYPDEASWRAAGTGYARIREQGVMEGELELARKDGSRLWCRLQSRALDAERPERSAIVAFSDIQDRRVAAQALRASEAMFRNLVETSNDLIWSMDAAGRWSYLNPAAVQRIYGHRPEDLLGREFQELLAQEIRERDMAMFRRVLGGEPLFNHETRHARRDGTHVDLVFNAIPLRDEAGAVVGATGTAHDVTRERASTAVLHETVERLRLAVQVAELEYWEWDAATDSMFFGRGPHGATSEARRLKFSDYLRRVHDEDRERLREASLATQRGGKPYELDFRIVDSSGRERWMHARGIAMPDRNARIARVIGVFQDITERKRQEEEARFLSYHDTLTGLPNRRLLDDRLSQALYLSRRRDNRVAVMMIDLDHFKQVNDALGHRAGDVVLRDAAQRLGGCVRKADTLARHGGDEFVVVMNGVRSADDCGLVAAKILRAMEAPFVVEGRAFKLGVSIGVSLFPADADESDALLRNADVAMYRAKQQGGNCSLFYGT